MFEDDRSYYQHRAELETALAQEATQPQVVKAHADLAKAYFRKLAAVELAIAEKA